MEQNLNSNFAKQENPRSKESADYLKEFSALTRKTTKPSRESREKYIQDDSKKHNKQDNINYIPQQKEEEGSTNNSQNNKREKIDLFRNTKN